MSNQDIDAAWRYHNETKHSYRSLRQNRHTLDFENLPLPYKIYSSLEPIPLPRDFPPSPRPALDAIAGPARISAGQPTPNLETVARLCFFSNGITRRLRAGQRTTDFRAAACTGALYHVELYLLCGDLPGLAAGLYHYGVHDHALRQLRAGDFGRVLVEATGREPVVTEAAAVMICTSTFWRNAWKYQARAYRHTFWDTGTVLANLLSEAAAIELPATLVLGFGDAEVNRLLDVDEEREAAIGLVAIGRRAQDSPDPPPIPPLDSPTVPLSRTEVEYPAIQAMHRASSLPSTGVDAWRAAPLHLPASPSPGPLYDLQPLDPAELPPEPLDRVIRRRGSTRQFTYQPVSSRQLATLLDRATRGFRADCLEPGASTINQIYLIVNAVDGLPDGAYLFRRDSLALELLKRGSFRQEAGYLALGQELGAAAAADLYFLADLEPVLARYGNRGYRMAQLEAAITAGKLYLAAYALGLGATGLTFFDDDVTAFFSPHAAGKSVMFLIALGHPAKRR